MASDQQVQGLQAKLVFDRDTASRLGITPSTIDQTLYDAYGQREVSTMFTQLNQYHVVLEVKPGFQQNPLDLARPLYPDGRRGRQREARAWCRAELRPRSLSTGPKNSRGQRGDLHRGRRRRHRRRAPCSTAARLPRRAFPNGGQVPLSAFTQVQTTVGAHHGQSPGTVSGGDAFVQSGAQRLAGRRGERGEQGEGRTADAGQHSGRVSGHGGGVSGIAGQRAGADSGGAGHGVYRAGRAV